MNLAPFGWWISCLWEAARFRHACQSVASSQEQQLLAILKRSQNSEFGRRHHFSNIRTADDFREFIPLSRYSDYADSIERIRQGQSNILTQEPVLILEPTSGSSGGPKLIPYTESLRQEFQRGVAAWIADLFWNVPALMTGRHYWSISPPARVWDNSSAAVPVGFSDDASYLGDRTARLVRSMLAVGPQVLESPDYIAATANALIECPNLVFASVWSPTFWLLILDQMPNPPQLKCLSCWGDGYSQRYLEQIKARMPGVLIQKKGLLATEGICTIPLMRYHQAALAVRSHFFEFLDPLGRSLLAHQLQLDQRYEIVLTTSGGLYRYRLGDLVEVTGWHHQCPLLRFVGRADGLTDRFGEKLCPQYVANRLPSQGLAFLAFEGDSYVLFGGDQYQADALEAQLCQDNFHYATCRRIGQLKSLRPYPLAPTALTCYYDRLHQLGQRAGDIKPLPIRPEEDWSHWLPQQ